MWCLRLRWFDQCFHLTVGNRIEEIPATDERVRLFRSGDSARQFLKHALGSEFCDLYPAYVGNTALLTARQEAVR